MARPIFLRPDSDDISNALKAAAEKDLRSVNAYALSVLEEHLRTTGYLE